VSHSPSWAKPHGDTQTAVMKVPPQTHENRHGVVSHRIYCQQRDSVSHQHTDRQMTVRRLHTPRDIDVADGPSSHLI
jgi:hypothetical protein